jgi:hypothetical protein
VLAAPALAQPATECASTRARAEMEEIGRAMWAWYLDVVSAANGVGGDLDPICPDSPPLDVTAIPPINSGILAIFLVPNYIAQVPSQDPWGHAYEYRLDVADPLSADVMSVRSAGSDGLFEGAVYDFGATSGPQDDLLLYDNVWVRDLPRLDPVSRQRTTVARVEEVGAALLSWITDVVSALSGDPSLPGGNADMGGMGGMGGQTVDMDDYRPVSVEKITTLLTNPLYYTRCVPKYDAWGTPIEYRLNSNVLGAHVAAIRSFGSDAMAEGDFYEVGAFPADEREHDIVWADGLLVRAPDDGGAEIFFDGVESGATWGYWSCGPGF